MATGACGIDCTTCRLHLRGECSSCGPAMGQLADLKLETQKRLLGAPCPLLACARLNRINHCLAECDFFPCENYTAGPYPFSNTFLHMQQRRREEMNKRSSCQDDVEIAPEHWQALCVKNHQLVERASGAKWNSDDTIELDLLNLPMRIIPGQQRVEMQEHGGWHKVSGFSALVPVMYLLSAKPVPLDGQWLTEKELSTATFFRGLYRMPLGQLLEQFGSTPEAFIETAGKLGGTITRDDGDGAVLFWVLPKVPVKLILWCRDEELPPAITVLFDKSIESFLPPDAIWAMINFLQERMVAQTR